MEFFNHPLVVVVLGFVIGTLGALVGVGGGFFVVPFLLFTRTDTPAEASGSSLVLVTLNAISATIRFTLQKQILWKLGIILGLATVPGAYLGPLVVQGVDVGLFQVLFSFLLLACAGYAILLSFKRFDDDPSKIRYIWWLAILVSLATGFISSMFGIGGGIIHMPLLLFALLVPAGAASATSKFALMITAIVGGAVYLFKGQILWDVVWMMAPGMIIGAQIGAWLTKKVNARIIRAGFAVIALVVALQMLVKGWGNL